MERRISDGCAAVIDWNGNFWFINSSLHRQLGSNSLMLMHQSFFDLIPEEEEEKLRHAMACSVLTEKRSFVETGFRREMDRRATWQVESIGKASGGVDRYLLMEINDNAFFHENSSLVAAAVQQARKQERTRIGLELHDNVNQILFTCKLYLDLIKPAVRQDIELRDKTLEFILMAIEEIRLLSKDLVSPVLKDTGIISCIMHLLDELRVTGLFKIDFRCGNENKIETIDDRIKLTLFRIIQEQLKNIVKYSRAQQVSVELSVIAKKVHLVVEDDGIGFDADAVRNGIGLSNICERTKICLGKTVIKTKPGQGCRITVIIPVI